MNGFMGLASVTAPNFAPTPTKTNRPRFGDASGSRSQGDEFLDRPAD